MMFVKYNGAANNDFMKLKVKLDAKTVILLHSITLGEEKLNEYLIDTEGLDLIKASLYLLAHCKTYQDKDGTIITLFDSRQADKLASLITYGNGEIKGSDVLKDAFMRS